VVKIGAPPPLLKVGRSGSVDARHYRIANHAVVEIAQVGLLVYRHEYFLRDDEGHDALLVQGAKPGATNWCLFMPLHPAEPLTPQQAGAVRGGSTVTVDGIVTTIDELFRSSIRQADNPDGPELKTGEILYGFSGRTGSTLLLTRWNENAITFGRGKLLPEQTVLTAFGQPSDK
jgi:hypothetical protein